MDETLKKGGSPWGLPSVLCPPLGHLFEVEVHLRSGNKVTFYADRVNDDLSDFHIPTRIRDLYPDAIIRFQNDPNEIAAFALRVVFASKLTSENESPQLLHTVDGEPPADCPL